MWYADFCEDVHEHPPNGRKCDKDHISNKYYGNTASCSIVFSIERIGGFR